MHLSDHDVIEVIEDDMEGLGSCISQPRVRETLQYLMNSKDGSRDL